MGIQLRFVKTKKFRLMEGADGGITMELYLMPSDSTLSRD